MPVVIDVDSGAFDAASVVFGQDMAGALGIAHTELMARLRSSGGMAGSDPAGVGWAREYDPACEALAATIGDLRNSCLVIAGLLQATGFNHGQAEAASDPTRTVATGPDATQYNLALPDPMVCATDSFVPPAEGGSGGGPPGWGVVEHAVGYLWPNGHPGKLRTAAHAWSRAAVAVESVAGYVPEAVQAVMSQVSPEIDDAVTVCTSMSGHLADTAACARGLAAACGSLAEHIETAHHEIEQELDSFLKWSAAIEGGGLLGSAFSLGASELIAQGVESGRIAATGARIAAIIRTLVEAARTVAATITGITSRVAETAARLRPILGARLSRAATTLVEKLPAIRRFRRETEAARGLELTAHKTPWDAALKLGAKKVPDKWGRGVVNKKGEGTRWTDPARQGNGIRIDRGVSNSPWPSQRVDHVVIRYNGRILGPDGKPITGPLNQNPQAHIPLSDWLKWSTWNHP